MDTRSVRMWKYLVYVGLGQEQRYKKQTISKFYLAVSVAHIRLYSPICMTVLFVLVATWTSRQAPSLPLLLQQRKRGTNRK